MKMGAELFENRKSEHLDLALGRRSKSSLCGTVHDIHPEMPSEIRKNDFVSSSSLIPTQSLNVRLILF